MIIRECSFTVSIFREQFSKLEAIFLYFQLQVHLRSVCSTVEWKGVRALTAEQACTLHVFLKGTDYHEELYKAINLRKLMNRPFCSVHRVKGVDQIDKDDVH